MRLEDNQKPRVQTCRKRVILNYIWISKPDPLISCFYQLQIRLLIAPTTAQHPPTPQVAKNVSPVCKLN